MANTAYVVPTGIGSPSNGENPGPVGLQISFVVFADDGTITAGPEGPFAMSNFSNGDTWADISAACVTALQGLIGDPDLTVVFLPG
jgi:hypothetical protein